MNFIKTNLLSMLSIGTKIIGGIIINKLIAIYGNANGLALAGQFLNIFTLLISICNGLINTGVVKYTADYNKDINKFNILLNSVIQIMIIGGVLAILLAMILHNQLSQLIFREIKPISLILTIVLIGFFVSIGVLMNSIQNGLGHIRNLSIINILGNILGIVIAYFLIIGRENDKIIWAVAAPQIAVCLISFGFVPINVRKHIFKNKNLRTENILMIKRLLGFSFMAIIWNITNPVLQLLVREIIIENGSMKNAGLWQALNKLSEGYVGLITGTFVIYIIPIFSSLSGILLQKEIIKMLIISICLVSILGSGILLFREKIIITLFSDKFLSIKNLMPIQIIGDIERIASWVLINTLIAKSKIKQYVIFEIIFGISYFLAICYLSPKMGLMGATISYTLSYGIYLINLSIYVKREIINI